MVRRSKSLQRTLLIGVGIVSPALLGAILDWFFGNRFPCCLFVGAFVSTYELIARCVNRVGTSVVRVAKPDKFAAYDELLLLVEEEDQAE